ncbi:50S ribosomal protein L25/general stress protein Ctc [uncultured Porphyromonas sp.]|uniref:50S ribosomal protein L25/general stress protein Ctc n=1 Tax=uncultured Porphyromonas sp. TaxID=159274 RepID=UPI002609B6A2|nr:50S ribosomal protein L25/general stress protein Ctc [uncultured Porphyromonas sp.]
MQHFTLSASVRKADQLGKKATKSLRREGLVPVVLYGASETQHLVVKADDINKLIYTPNIYLIELDIEGKQHKAVLKDVQFHPVSDKTLHADLYEVSEDKPIVMSVPVLLEGHAVGVRAGGKLVREKRTLRVRASYDKIPERLTIDVTKLKLGKTIQVHDLSFDNLELVDAPQAVVCAVKATRVSGKATQETETEEEHEHAEGAEEGSEQAAE